MNSTEKNFFKNLKKRNKFTICKRRIGTLSSFTESVAKASDYYTYCLALFFHNLLYILCESDFYCGKRLLPIEFCISKIQIFKGECLLTIFNTVNINESLQVLDDTIEIRIYEI